MGRSVALWGLTLLLACGDVERPDVVGGASGAGSSGASSAEGSSTGETGESGDGGQGDAPCEEVPDFRFVMDPAGLEGIELGTARTQGCLETAVVGIECSGETTTVGAAVADFDEDGRADLALVGAESSGALMRNLGDGRFTDVSAERGVDLSDASGAAWLDVDKDGDLDLFVSTWRGTRNRLFINQGAGASFTEEAEARGVARLEAGPIGGTSVAVGDLDLDGWPELFTTGWQPFDSEGPNPNRLFRNLGADAPGSFEDITVARGVEMAGRGVRPNTGEAEFWWGMSASFIDLTGDDAPELVVVGDYESSDVFVNDGSGGLSSTPAAMAMSAALERASSGMGVAWGDYDLDGDLDAYVTSISEPPAWGCSADFDDTLGGRFFEYVGALTLESREDSTRTRCSGWGWGTTLSDFDNDGLLDLAVTNGYSTVDYSYDPDRYYVGRGDFSLPMPQCAVELGMEDDGQGRSLHVMDFDGDGDLDLLETRAGDHPFIYVNEGGSDTSWLRVRARGRAGLTTGRGARLALRTTAEGPWMVRTIGLGSEFMGHDELVAHFGLGGASEAAELRICWPSSRRMQRLTAVEANQLLVLDEDAADTEIEGPCAAALLAP